MSETPTPATSLTPILKKRKTNDTEINHSYSEPVMNQEESTVSEEPVTSEEEDEGPIEMVDEINNAFSALTEEDRTIGGSNLQ